MILRKPVVIILGFILLFATEICRVYFIMPFPGSQQKNTIDLAYFIHTHIWWFRILALILVVPGLVYYFRRKNLWTKALLTVAVMFYVFIFYQVNFRFLADHMFLQPTNKNFVPVKSSRVDSNALVIATVINGQARAYPIQVIGYHHQVQDTLGGTPIMVTYCTVCRTGRIFSPFVDNQLMHFRLVGMDHFNAMFEDESTKTWWRQVTGEAIAGPKKGQQLQELPSQQMRLGAWIREHPSTLIMQPDQLYVKKYASLSGYDSGTIDGGLEHHDSTSWSLKSWVIGVSLNGQSRAYDWNQLKSRGFISDSMGTTPLLVLLENDSVTFHVFNRRVQEQTLQFETDDYLHAFRDVNTHSLWNANGTCVDGALKGTTLMPVQSYQEFWHSWKTFHPATTQYK